MLGRCQSGTFIHHQEPACFTSLTFTVRERVVAQLVERLLSIPEVRSLTPFIGKIYNEHLFVYLFIINSSEKTKINKKMPGMAHFKKQKHLR